MFSSLQKLKAKRKLIFIAALLLASVLLTLRFGSSSSRDLALGFVGFTNSVSQSHALFWMTNRTSPELWWFHHASLKTGDDWRQDGSNYQQLLFFDYYGPPETRHVIRLVGVPVSATNVSLRVVFECLEQIPIQDRLEEFYQQRIRNRSVYVANGRHYFVTNEVPHNHPLQRSISMRPWPSSTLRSGPAAEDGWAASPAAAGLGR